MVDLDPLSRSGLYFFILLALLDYHYPSKHVENIYKLYQPKINLMK